MSDPRIRWFVGQLHVSMPLREACGYVASKIRNWETLPYGVRFQVLRQVAREHKANLALYVGVMGGQISR